MKGKIGFRRNNIVLLNISAVAAFKISSLVTDISPRDIDATAKLMRDTPAGRFYKNL